MIRKITTRSTEQGPAYSSNKGWFFLSWSGDIYFFLVAVGRFSFSIDAKNG